MGRGRNVSDQPQVHSRLCTLVEPDQWQLVASMFQVMTTDATTRRIHILGGPGSGKSTLALRLGQFVGAPVYDLDTIVYAAGAGPKRSLNLRHSLVTQIASLPGWIAEGIYLAGATRSLEVPIEPGRSALTQTPSAGCSRNQT
jgi:hypothetical protein